MDASYFNRKIDWDGVAHSAIDSLVVTSPPRTSRPAVASMQGRAYGLGNPIPATPLNSREHLGLSGIAGSDPLLAAQSYAHPSSGLRSCVRTVETDWHSMSDTSKMDIKDSMAELKSSMCDEMERLVRRELDASFNRLKTWMKEILLPEHMEFSKWSQHGMPSHIQSHASEYTRHTDTDVARLQSTMSEGLHLSHSACSSRRLSRSSPVGEVTSYESAPTVGRVSTVFRSMLASIQVNNVEDLRALLQSDADPNMVVPEYKPYNFRKSHSSVDSTHFDNSKAHKTFKNCSFLTIAVLNQNIDIMRLLVSFGAKLDTRHTCSVGSLQDEWSGSVIFAAPVSQDVMVLKELVEMKADPHEVNADNSNLISQCCYEQNQAMVAYLLEAGVAFDIAAASHDHAGVSYPPLHIATRLGCVGIVELLLEAKAENTANEEGISPLHDSISLWQPQVTYLLVSRGAQLVDSALAPEAVTKVASSRSGKDGTEFGSTMELLLQSINPLVLEEAARGLQYQEMQVKGLTIEDILRFLKKKGRGGSKLMTAIFRERFIRYRSKTMNEVFIRSAFVNHFTGSNSDSFVNTAATRFSHHDLEMWFDQRKVLDDEMHVFMNHLAPDLKKSKWSAKLSGYRQVLTPVSTYESLVPDFHSDLRILEAIIHSKDDGFFESKQCQALINEAKKPVRWMLRGDAILQLLAILIDIILTRDAHHLCTAGVDDALCLNWHLRTIAFLALPLWSINVFIETLTILGYLRHGWLRSYLFTADILTVFTYVRILSYVAQGTVLIEIIAFGEDTLPWSDFFQITFAVSCALKWFQFMSTLTAFRQVGRPLMPVLHSVGELWPLIQLFIAVCAGFIHFWIALNFKQKESFFDFVVDSFYFGMTADFESVADFRDPEKNAAFLHTALVVLTFVIPVILMNCTIASMSTSYANAAEHVEKYYQRLLGGFVFRHSTCAHMLRTICLTRSSRNKAPQYLWYCCELGGEEDLS